MRTDDRSSQAPSTPWRGLSDKSLSGTESGFTLIELVIVTLLLPIIIGAITLALVSIFSIQGTVANRISDSSDAQVVSTNFESDVQAASYITTNVASANPAPCQTASQKASDQLVLSLEIGNDESEVSYIELANGPISGGPSDSYSLVRNECRGGTTAPASSSTVSFDIPSGQQAQVSCTATAASQCSETSPTNYSNSWINAANVTGVTFSTTELASNYPYTLVGVPRANSVQSEASATAISTNSTCGFATPSPLSTYASDLCFVDFTVWNTYTGASSPQCTGRGLYIASAIDGTPYTLEFCISVSTIDRASGNAINGKTLINSSGGSTSVAGWNGILATILPTYVSPPPGSAAFLGNNGFYTGVPGNPALYESDEGSTSTITITQIQVVDSDGDPATGWDLVTGDAESTDQGESMTWSTGSSGPGLFDLANSPTSEMGNACADPTPGTSTTPGDGFSGNGTQTVECQASISEAHTGTVMLEAKAPSNLTVTLYGGGLEAMFLGILLPS